MSLKVNQPELRPTVKRAKDPVSLMIDCAVESFVEALMAIIWGTLVFDLVGGILDDMIPSPPPGMSGTPSRVHHDEAGGSGGNWFASGHHLFWTVFAIFFVLNLRARLLGPAPTGSKRETRLHRVAVRLREEGLSLLFINAFGAMIAAWMASLATSFSWSQFFLHWLFDAIAPTLHQWGNALFGQAHTGALNDWWNWWGNNQFKFTFWFFYITAICDDLGIPNLKTLARFGWRRARQRRQAVSVPPSGQQPA